MANILDKIMYDGKPYSIASPIGKKEIEALASRLVSLEDEIINCEEGIIMISPSGLSIAFSFPEDLSGRITGLIKGH